MQTARYVDQVFDSRIGRPEASGDAIDRDNPTFYIDPLYGVQSIQVLWVNVPFSFWVIDNLNNRFQMLWRDAPDLTGPSILNPATNNTWVDLYLTPGTYTPAGFQQEFRRAVSTGNFFTSDTAPNVIKEVNVQFNNGNGRMVFYHTIAQNMEFRLRFPTSELAEMLGFRKYSAEVGDYISGEGPVWKDGVPVIGGNIPYIASERTVKLIGVPRLNLHGSLSGDIGKVGGMTRVNQNAGSDRLVSFPINGVFGSYLYYQVPSQPIESSSEVIDQVSFYLTHGDRKQYARRNQTTAGSYDMSLSASYNIVNYLPLNGEGFQVCVRFFLRDDL
jgi:hypothetical protein